MVEKIVYSQRSANDLQYFAMVIERLRTPHKHMPIEIKQENKKNSPVI